MTDALRSIISEHVDNFFLRVLHPPKKREFLTDAFRFADNPGSLSDSLSGEGYICRVERGLCFITPSDALLEAKARAAIKAAESPSFGGGPLDFETEAFIRSLSSFRYKSKEQPLAENDKELLFMLLCPLYLSKDIEGILVKLRRLAAICLRERRGSLALTLGAAVLRNHPQAE